MLIPSMHMRRAGVLAAGAILLAAVGADAAFNLSKPTFSSGAAAVAGGSFRLGATIGESGVVGSVSGGSFRLIEGFWQPNMGIATSVEGLPGDLGSNPAEVIRYTNAYRGNFPSPFREVTSISFTVAGDAPVSVVIYDVSGRRVRTLLDEARPAGAHAVRWNGDDDRGRPLASGLYFARLAIGTWSETKRILRIR